MTDIQKRYYVAMSSNAMALFNENRTLHSLDSSTNGKKILHYFIAENVCAISAINQTTITRDRIKIQFNVKNGKQIKEKVIHLMPQLKNNISISKAEAILIGITGMGRSYV